MIKEPEIVVLRNSNQKTFCIFAATVTEIECP